MVSISASVPFFFTFLYSQINTLEISKNAVVLETVSLSKISQQFMLSYSATTAWVVLSYLLLARVLRFTNFFFDHYHIFWCHFIFAYMPSLHPVLSGNLTSMLRIAVIHPHQQIYIPSSTKHTYCLSSFH